MGDESPSGRGEEPLVPVASVWDVLEAEMIVGRLREEGIEAIIRSESLSTVMGLTVDGLGRRDVLVRAGSVEEAKKVLRDIG